MHLHEFVTRVLATQEQAVLDWLQPTDDLFKMVLYNANNVLEEFQDEAYWSFLREKVVLGTTEPDPREPNKSAIPEFRLPPWANRVSMLYQDRLMLHPYKHYPDKEVYLSDIDYNTSIEVPYASKGSSSHAQNEFGKTLNLVPEPVEPLKAIVVGNVITFNRPLIGSEAHRAAVIDVQREIPRMHICNDHCIGKDKKKPICYDKGENYNPCREYEKPVLEFMPSPDYIILKTACYNADGSEIAQDLAMKLADRAKTRLSKMRELDSAFTDVDQLEFEPIEIYCP